MPVHNKGARAVHRNVRNTQGTPWARNPRYRFGGHARYRVTHMVQVWGHASRQYMVVGMGGAGEVRQGGEGSWEICANQLTPFL